MKHDKQISIAKGIAIILMVMGHSWTGSRLESFVNMFHMPLFFFTAGYCFKEQHYLKPRVFIYRRFRGILRPYFFWSILFVLLHNELLSCGLIQREVYSITDVCIRLRKILSLELYTEDLIGAYWFLPVLFLSEILAFVTLLLSAYRHGRSDTFCFVVFVLLALCGKVLVVIPRMIPQAWNVGNAMFAALFFEVGHVFKKNQGNVGAKQRLEVAVVSAIVLVAGFNLWRSSLTTCSVKKAPFYVISAVSGIYLVLMLARRISKLPHLGTILSFAGNHSLSIMTWHFCAFKVVTLFLMSASASGSLSDFPTIPLLKGTWWWLYSLAGVGLPLLGTLAISFVSRKAHFTRCYPAEIFGNEIAAKSGIRHE